MPYVDGRRRALLSLLTMPQITAVTDLTFGDGSKGTSVQRLVKQTGSTLVIRAGGGSQCAHTIISPEGQTHTFSQFGSGSFLGAKTFYGPRAYFNPMVMDIEALKLEKKGVVNPKKLFYVHEDALVTTPFHRALNRLRELSRNINIHGSCGVGIGETARIAIEYPALALRVKDLLLPAGYLGLYYEDLIKQIWNEIKELKPLLDLKYPAVLEEVATFKLPLPELINRTKDAIKDITVVTKKETASFLSTHDQIVAEGNQGILIDQDYGFHPYTTWSKTTSENVHLLCAEYCLPHKIVDYGVIRTFLTRHGAGPFPTESKGLEAAFAEVHNTDNPWQRAFRFGHFDLPLMQYAIKVNKGIDGLILSHTDWLGLTKWLCATQYEGMLDIPVLKYPNLIRQEEIGKQVGNAVPIYDLREFAPEDVGLAIQEMLETKLVMTSYGPEFGKYTLHNNV